MEAKLKDRSHDFSPADHAPSFFQNAKAEWQLSPLSILAIHLFPALVVFTGVGLLLFNRPLYHLYIMEDGVAEDGQVLFYALALIFALAIAVRLRRRLKGLSFLYFGLAAGLFFLTGEEISWGQRIFNWVTPGWLGAVNQQHETTIHNIREISAAFQWGQLLIGAYGGLLPLLVPRIRALQPCRKVTSLVIPHYVLIVYFLPHFFWRIYRNIFALPQKDFRAIAEFNEVLELNIAAGFLLFTLYQWRRLRGSRDWGANDAD